MSVLRTVWDETIGLFIDDGRFALAIAAWVALCWFMLPRLGWSPFVLFGGLAAILAESAIRAARP